MAPSLTIQCTTREKFFHLKLSFQQALIERMADKALEVGAIFFDSVRPWIVTESRPLLFKKMPAPNKA